MGAVLMMLSPDRGGSLRSLLFQVFLPSKYPSEVTPSEAERPSPGWESISTPNDIRVAAK